MSKYLEKTDTNTLHIRKVVPVVGVLDFFLICKKICLYTDQIILIVCIYGTLGIKCAWGLRGDIVNDRNNMIDKEQH